MHNILQNISSEQYMYYIQLLHCYLASIIKQTDQEEGYYHYIILYVTIIIAFIT